EIAHAAGVDPVAFRLKYVKDPRHVAVIKAAADRAGWSKRTYPSLRRGKGPVMIGRGFSYTERNGTIVAVVAEVEVSRSSGRVWPRHLTGPTTAGRIITPRGLGRRTGATAAHARARQGRAGCGRDETMSTRRLAVVFTGFAVALMLAGSTSHPAGAQAPAAALTGRVTSAADGPLAGVLVSARKAGSTVTVTV